MKKNQQGFGRTETLLALVSIIAIALLGWYVWDKKPTTQQQNLPESSRNTSPNTAEGSRVVYAGTVESVDLSEMAADGDGIFVIKTDTQRVTVHLSSGESNCDRTAISIPNVRPGDEVKVSGDKDSDGIVRVCDSGSYIKH